MRKSRVGRLALAAALLASPVLPASAQIESPETLDVEQLLVDLDALIIGANVTVRCALFDDTLDYLSPLEAVASEYRIRQIGAQLAGVVPDLAERISTMRREASAIACGHDGLEPFLAFNSQIATDLIEVALIAWSDLSIAECSYFVDDDFLAAAERARSAAVRVPPEPDPSRAAYRAAYAALWEEVFEDNCYNVAFNPIETLPGQIALALPIL